MVQDRDSSRISQIKSDKELAKKVKIFKNLVKVDDGDNYQIQRWINIS